ncbi:TPA: glycosyltransferase family 4 protein [Streptococcus suis]|nr:glycosyltransferase family 4 protein [Streptococcus suis]
MKIGILFDDVGKAGLDYSAPPEGNPGVGGTQYCFLMLMYYLSNIQQEDEIIVYCWNHKGSVFPKNKNLHIKYINEPEEAIELSVKDTIDIFLFNFSHMLTFQSLLEKSSLRCITWVHNWVRGKLLNAMVECSAVKRVVFLGQEHYDRYIDSPIMDKAVVLPNMFNTEGYIRRDKDLSAVVTYVGALIPSKGFHALAAVWKDVIRAFPEAKLYVLGAGNLYGTVDGGIEPVFGKLGIADREYEEQFLKYITDKDGKLLPSIHFLGNVGREKIDIYKKTKVGIVNPTGRTEVCPISALEMGAAEVPVISKNINGLPDVVINGQTGLLVNSKKQLTQSIIELLSDDEKNKQLGEHARNHVFSNFNPENITQQWVRVFKDMLEDGEVEVISPSKNMRNNFKWARVVLYNLKKIPLFHNLPAMIEIEDWISKILYG